MELTKQDKRRIKEETDNVMAAFMVPNCIYRGFCPEKDSCGYWTGKRFECELNEYRNLIGRGKNV